MIYIDRRTVRPPEQLFQVSEEAAHKIRAQWQHLGSQQRLEFNSRVWFSYRSVLQELFHGKCAFCESPLDVTQSGDFEHFRPKSSVDEDPKHPGYFWLAYDWRNLYLVCRICNTHKRNHFPILGTRVYKPEDSLVDEQPLLLDPCESVEPPEPHLQFV